MPLQDRWALVHPRCRPRFRVPLRGEATVDASVPGRSHGRCQGWAGDPAMRNAEDDPRGETESLATQYPSFVPAHENESVPGSLNSPERRDFDGERGRDNTLATEEPHATTHAVAEQTHGTGAEVRRERRGRPGRVELETLVEATRCYLSELRGYNPETIKDMQRRLRNVCKDLWQLRKAPASSPRVSTTDPKQLSAEDIGILVEHWRKEGLSPSYQAKLIDALDGFLLWASNPVLTTMRKMKHIRLPKAIYKDIVVLTQADRERLRAAANSMDGWGGSIARLLIALLPCS